MADISETLHLILAQLNPTVGAIDANAKRVIDEWENARLKSADVIVFPELFLSGYPPEDLILKPSFLSACMAALSRIAKATAQSGPGIILGTPFLQEGKAYNAVCFICEGEIKATRFKRELPDYGVFDESRVFEPGPAPGPVIIKGFRVGLPICEDIWEEEVPECLMETGAQILISINGSPFDSAKADIREQIVIRRVIETGLPLIYLNQVCGQDELVFDGGSFGLNSDKHIAFQAPQFEEALIPVTLVNDGDEVRIEKGNVAPPCDKMSAIWRACVLGLRDYVEKNRFKGVVLGLSGGIDSAICAAMSVDALGPERVRCVMLPYRYTSQESLEDAAACAKALGVHYEIIDIAPAVEGFMSSLSGLFEGTQAGVTEENIQSRARGAILMAISNKFGEMVVTTGNKSEMSVGYATLYGDMNGGFNPIKDLYKTEVFELATWRNQNHSESFKGPNGEVIPTNILTKPPTAELRENQTDQDSLPPYEILDQILRGLVEDERSVDDLMADGLDEATIRRIEHLLYIAEYKRRQAAPGVKVSRRNFGRDRRYPITNGFRH